MYVCSNFGPLLLFNAAAIDYQLQKSIWHMQMSLFCLLLPAWCLIIFGTKLLHICAWPHFWFMKQLISLVNLHGKLFIAFMVYSAHRIQQPIFKTTNPECSRFSDCFWQKKREKKTLVEKFVKGRRRSFGIGCWIRRSRYILNIFHQDQWIWLFYPAK